MRKKIAALLAASIVLGRWQAVREARGVHRRQQRQKPLRHQQLQQEKANQLKIQTAKRRLC